MGCGALAVGIWLQSPEVALYALVALCPFDITYSIGEINRIGATDLLIVALAVPTVLTLAAGSPRRLRFDAPATRLVLLLWLFLLVWGSITFLLGPANSWFLRGPVRNAWYVYEEVGRSLLVFPLVLVCLNNRQSIERVIDLLVLVGTGVSLNAIWLARLTGENATGHFATGNALAGYLILIIPFATARLMIGSSWRSRILHGLALLVLLRAMWLAGSRGGFVAFACSALVVGLLAPRRRAAAAAVAGALGLVILASTRGHLLESPMVQRFIVLKNPNEVETLQWREQQWEIFLQRIYKRPLLGWGSEVDESLRDQDRAQTAHNAFLALSVKSGVPAAVAWGLLLLSLVGIAVRWAFTHGVAATKSFWAGTMGFLVALTVHNLVESTLLTGVTQHLVWIMTACVLLQADFARSEAEPLVREARTLVLSVGPNA
jgi:O-antigen ligase